MSLLLILFYVKIDHVEGSIAGVKTTSSFKDVLNNEAITAVVIAVPSPLHYSFGKQVLLSGKDLYVEKPMTLKLSDADDLVEIAENNKRILMVCKKDI